MNSDTVFSPPLCELNEGLAPAALGQGSATPWGPGRVPTKRALCSQAARTCSRADWPRANRGGSPPLPLWRLFRLKKISN
jgi:hypothetical protein